MSVEARPAIAHIKATHIDREGKLIDRTREAQQPQPKPERPGWLGGFLGRLRKKELSKQPEGPKHVLEGLEKAKLTARIEGTADTLREIAESDTGSYYGRNEYYNAAINLVNVGEIERRRRERKKDGENVPSGPIAEVPQQLSSFIKSINEAAGRPEDVSISTIEVSGRRINVVTNSGIEISLQLPIHSGESSSNYFSLHINAGALNNPAVQERLQAIQSGFSTEEDMLSISEELVGYTADVVANLPAENAIRVKERVVEQKEAQRRQQEVQEKLERGKQEQERIRGIRGVNRQIKAALGMPRDDEAASERAESKEKFEVLSDRDQRYLDEATRNIMLKILEQYPENLPDAVILPDTSARPLAYLIRPIFAEIARQRGLKSTPELIFFKSQNKDLEYAIDELPEVEEEYERQTNKPDALKKEAREIHTKRADEIISYLEKRHPDPRMIIIDDYASEEFATVKTIRNAFANKNIPAYPLVGMWDFDSRDQIYEGLVDPETESSAGVISMRENIRGFEFDYRKHEAEAIEKPSEVISRIGVTKQGQEQELYSRKNENTSIEQMQKLRHDMTLIGERIAQDILQAV